MVQYNPSLCRDQLVLTEVAQRVDWPSDIAENLCAYLSCGKMCVEFKGEYINGGYCDKNRAFCGLNTTEKFSYGKNPDYEEEDRVVCDDIGFNTNEFDRTRQLVAEGNIARACWDRSPFADRTLFDPTTAASFIHTFINNGIEQGWPRTTWYLSELSVFYKS